MRIAFDFDGTLYQQAPLRWLAKALHEQGHDLYVITWVPEHYRDTRLAQVRKLQDELCVCITNIFVVCGNAAEEKVKVMKDNNISWLIDDDPTVCAAVRGAGLGVMEVKTVPHWLPETTWDSWRHPEPR